jgi:hypothetical protein
VNQRPTVELVALLFTATVCVFLVITTAGVVVSLLLHPGDVAAAGTVDRLATVMATVVGALLGLLAGRHISRR